eukprot:CAMPEP_0172212170 /NCGR_PEP_ID=MMETSP1050-20130122/36842_1 /TAXON_ID=233186 /ORGANISM="Cryptomonas curvata, Strain CCAP979/52" /LENGTH=255 /DNA_ID=CAMNT_0012892769 /DNA_START=149 /DNA_END=913 /DNA_ORIENTATION=+
MKMVFGPKTNVLSIDAAIKNALLMQTSCLESILYGQRGEPKYTSIKFAPYTAQSGDLIGIELNLSIEAQTKENIDVCTICADDNQIKSNNATVFLEEVPRKEMLNQEANGYCKFFAHEIIERVCIAHNIKPFKPTNKFRCFCPASVCNHQASCADSDPISISSITTFIKLLDHELSSYPACKIVVCADQGQSALTNAVLLLGAYMVLKMELGAEEVARRFDCLGASSSDVLRAVDAPCSTPDLTAHDCWRALERA